MNRLSVRALQYWRIDAAVTAAVVVGLTGAATAALWGWAGGWLLLAAVPVALAAIGYAIAMPRTRMAVHRWTLTGTDVIAEFGWLVRQRRIAPLVRVQTVDTRQGPLQRRLGVMDVVVTTASSAGAVVLPGLDEPVAAGIEEAIRARVGERAGDGT